MAEELLPLTFDSIVQMQVDFALASQDTIAGMDRPLTADDFLEGSVFLALFEGVANPIEYLMYTMLIDLPGRFYLNQAEGDALDRLVENFTFGQVIRVPASTAGGGMLIEGDPQTMVPANLLLRAPDGTIVKVAVAVTIPTGETEVAGAGIATEPGAAGNLMAGVELELVTPLQGITRITVSEQWAGGADIQSDESLRDAVVEFLDSLAKGVRAAIVAGARQGGYDRSVVIEPAAGRLLVYMDDGNVASSVKLEAARSNIHLNWKAAGIRLVVRPFVSKVVDITAKAFGDGTVPLGDLQAAIVAKWSAYLGAKRMGDGLDRLELVQQASTVTGYNGVNLNLPATDLVVRLALNDYQTAWGPGQMYPYERLTLGTVTWVD